MGFFSTLFGKNKTKNRVNRPIQEMPVNKITYKSDLIDSLKDDHQELFKIYGELVELANNDAFIKVPTKLGEFKLALQAHILVENVQFYVYVEELHKSDPTHSEFIRDVRKEMNTIARVVVNFVKKYQMKVFTPDVKKMFFEELNAIGEALTKRVEMEESKLYTLYVAG